MVLSLLTVKDKQTYIKVIFQNAMLLRLFGGISSVTVRIFLSTRIGFSLEARLFCNLHNRKCSFQLNNFYSLYFHQVSNGCYPKDFNNTLLQSDRHSYGVIRVLIFMPIYGSCKSPLMVHPVFLRDYSIENVLRPHYSSHMGTVDSPIILFTTNNE